MKIQIRKATIQDLDQIVKLADKMMDFHCSIDPYYCIYRKYEDYTNFYKEDLLNTNKLYIVSEDTEGNLIAFASASFLDPEYENAPLIGYLIANFVLPEYRNKGIGSEQLKQRMDWFKQKGVTYVEMNVDAKNNNALQLWRKKGFEDYQIKLKKRI